MRTRALAAVEKTESPFFRAALAPFRRQGDERAEIGGEAAEFLGVGEGDDVWILPLD